MKYIYTVGYWGFTDNEHSFKYYTSYNAYKSIEEAVKLAEQIERKLPKFEKDYVKNGYGKKFIKDYTYSEFIFIVRNEIFKGNKRDIEVDLTSENDKPNYISLKDYRRGETF